MIDGDIVTAIRDLASRGVGSKTIAKQLGIARNTVRRYRRAPVTAGVQVRPAARKLSDADRQMARELYAGVAAGNAVVVRRLLTERGVVVAERTIQRAVADLRRTQRAAALATVRVETPPGDQLQIDFGQKRIVIAGVAVRVFLLVAVLSYSRRLFVKAFLNERGDDWREGIAAAFRHFGGVPRVLLGDNARALVIGRDRATGTASFHPAYLAFCRDWDVQPRACAPYRARTKGKTEAGVKFVKCNALAELTFDSFAALEQHLVTWIMLADQRRHGTTREAPIVRFERDERAQLRPLPDRALPRRVQRVRRRVALDAFVDVDTVRYSVPHRLVRDHVDVAVGDDRVEIFHGTELVATHARSTEPFARVVNPQHYAGLWRVDTAPVPGASLAPLGRDLADYAAIIAGGGQ
ncbi:MAG TPA: IS21 family transposase [Rhodocyclaceae bacterium]|nr:IS21 family transposase [Rhodocyclaceae bacterium]HVN87213.1 IS21 family transposase [Candidatus Binatia bacterium]